MGMGRWTWGQWRFWLVLGVGGLLATPVRAAEPEVDLGGVREEFVLIPMRDGVRLAAGLYFPEGNGPWPVLLEQRYAATRDAGTRKAMAELARGGYVVALANFRGSQTSEGVWQGYRALGWGELQDGYDLVEWLAGQPWSTGKIGTFGSSQAGFAQNFLAVARPPHLVAQYMIDTGLSLYHEGYRIGGTTRPERFKGMDAVCRVAAHNRALLDEWFRHPTFDDYWKAEDCSLHFDKMNVPCFTIGSWYDFMNVGSIDSYVGRQHKGDANSRGRQQLLIGPWLHGRHKETNKAGELVYPENAKFPMAAHMHRWFDHHLKGADNGADRDPTIRYYVMGALGEAGAPGNEWREAPDWPVAAQSVPWYLHRGIQPPSADSPLQKRGRLGTDVPVSRTASLTYKADPEHPNSIPQRAFPGAADARPFEAQPDALTFTTDELPSPMEWTGKIVAEMFVSSDAPDTDLIVRVSDVYPDGRSILIVDYVRRLRYRDGYETEKFLEPNQVHPVKFDVGWISQVFNKGHRVRVTVASTGAPFYEPNPNTGEPLTLEWPSKTRVARNTLELNATYPSRIWAPVRK